MHTETETYLTVAEVASQLKLTSKTVYSYIKAGKLPAIPLGRNYRIRESDFREFAKPPAPAPRKPRNQRERVAQLMRRAS